MIAHLMLAAALLPSQSPQPLSPAETQKKFQLPPGLKIELVASEPQLESPVHAAFDARGRLWVVEMRDYPNGPKPGEKPAGRIKILEDKDGNGHFETAKIFAENLLFANGLLHWKDGVIVTAAPNIVWIRDTDGDDKADKTEILFEGFATQNPQLRVSHPIFGLDGWVYVANGLRGGQIIRHGDKNAKPINLSGMDFKFDPVTLEHEAISGQGQFGNAFDDWGNRFVCDNRHHLRHVVMENRYLARNPHLAAPGVIEDISELKDGPLSSGGKIYPISKNWTTSSLHEGQFTAACGVFVTNQLSSDPYVDFALTCDPTGNLVHAEYLKRIGGSFTSNPWKSNVEFLASPDDWFRPVSLLSGPDRSLYVVDMCRAVIEHPEFMPAELKNRPDLTLGKDRGRIWRVIRANEVKTRFDDLSKLSTQELASRLRSFNPYQRKTAQRLLLERHDREVARALREHLYAKKVPGFSPPLVAGLLGRIKALEIADLTFLFKESADTCRVGVLLAEKVPGGLAEVMKIDWETADPSVRFQLALTLGETSDPKRLPTLQGILANTNDKWTRLAVLSSIGGEEHKLFENLARDPKLAGERQALLLKELGALVGSRLKWENIDDAAASLSEADLAAGLEGLVAGIGRKGIRLQTVRQKAPEFERAYFKVLARAPGLAVDPKQDLDTRLSAIRFISDSDWPVLEKIVPLLTDDPQQEIRLAVVRSLGASSHINVREALLRNWRSYSPAMRREVLEAMMRQPYRIAALLDGLEQKQIKPGDLDPLRVRQLVNHTDPAIRERAKMLLAASLPGDRKEALARYQPALAKPGDAKRGFEIFKKNCATCHRILDHGVQVGPDIGDTRTKTPEALLADILNPNQAIDNNFVNYLVQTKSGKSLSGILVNETASSITLKRPEGQSDVVLRQDVEEIASTGVSLMPEGMEKNITVDEMADLISFLKNWRYLDGRTPGVSRP